MIKNFYKTIIVVKETGGNQKKMRSKNNCLYRILISQL